MTHLELKRPLEEGGYTIRSTPSMNTQPKKSKPSRRKKKRDPNEPQKPVSAYALFFRDSQASIKSRNPNLTFGDVSKMVASLWDSLDADSKSLYKKRTEMAKKEYLRQLASYRASLVSKGQVNCFPLKWFSVSILFLIYFFSILKSLTFQCIYFRVMICSDFPVVTATQVLAWAKAFRPTHRAQFPRTQPYRLWPVEPAVNLEMAQDSRCTRHRAIWRAVRAVKLPEQRRREIIRVIPHTIKNSTTR